MHLNSRSAALLLALAGILANTTLAVPVPRDDSHNSVIEARAGGIKRPPPDLDPVGGDPKRVDTGGGPLGGGDGPLGGEQSGPVTGPVWGQEPPPPPVRTGDEGGEAGPVGGGSRGEGADQAASQPPPPASNPDLQAMQDRGTRNVQNYRTAITDKTASVDAGDFGQKFNDHYTQRTYRAADGNLEKPPTTPEIDAFLGENGIDLNAPDVQRSEVFGRKLTDDDFNDPDFDDIHRSVFDAWMSPSGGWMYRTRMFRDASFDQQYELPLDQRIFMSEMMEKKWVEAAGDRPLNTIVGGNIEADDTVALLGDLRATSGANSGVIPATDTGRFNQAMGSSQGNVVSQSLSQHHSDPIFGDREPQSVVWRYNPDAFAEDADAFHMVKF